MLQELINKSLRGQDEKKKDRVRSGKFSPSMLGMCYRKQILNRANVPQSNPPDDRSLRVFKCGQLFHDFVQSFIDENKCIEVHCESEDFNGFADIVTEDTVYDIKSVHSKSFWYSKKPGYDVKKEKFNNWLQLAYYADVLKKEKMVLVFISKDDMCIEEYEQPLHDWQIELVKEFTNLKTQWDKKPELPPAEPRTKWDCGYGSNRCQYYNHCKEIETNANREHPFRESKSNRKSK